MRKKFTQETETMTPIEIGAEIRHVGLGHLEIDERAKAYINEVIAANRLSAGRFIGGFERAMAEAHGCRLGVMCNSGTNALQIALGALREKYGFEDGDEVIVPATTFIATSNIVLQNNMKPRFADVDPTTYNLDPELLQASITPRTRTVIPVHLCGLPCDMDPILRCAARHNLRIIEDCCEASFAEYKGRPVGSFGDIGCFSTYIAHIITTGVGGVMTTNDEELGIICRSMMNHGRDSIYLNIDDDNISDARKLARIIERRFSFVRMGYSARVTEFEGALGVAQMHSKDEILRRRRANGAYLMEQLSEWEEHLQLPTIPSQSVSSFMMFPIVVRDHISRDALIEFLEFRGIETRYLFPLLTQPYYRKLFGELADRFPVSQKLARRGFYIGCHHGLSREDLDYVVEVFRMFFATMELGQL